ncbi:M48 family metalloprotease [Bradyrhizobium quebecense]|uniref:M48 family metalloprotease n=1 Tax=Bradyrhizobium quebecense TaxID=2748629 RepID=A0ACD3VMW8_9BRAD|nr:M48 family metalloprotease [Bradyrhizobium quebecense]UGY07457.1 M48 family metalloprotease [Bradyrhizobium quebecense]
MMRIDPNRLPSGTGVNFLVIAISSVMVAFWSGQFLPGPDYFLTPFVAQFQPGVYSVSNGFYGLILLVIASAAFGVLLPRRQRRAFGIADEIEPTHPARVKIEDLAQAMSVRVDLFLSDRKIKNADAISFGIFRRKTMLLGKRLLLMSAKTPSAFLARAAHELGHFKNGDVKYVMMSRALLQADLFIMAIVLVWMLFRPARVVLMQYYLFIAPAPGLPGASPDLFFKLHGWQWASYWLDQTIGGLAITAPVFTFWMILLFLEYRSLLRTRELLADAQAVAAVGAGPLLKTLTGARNDIAPTLLQHLYEFISPHPLVVKRVEALKRPEKVLKPGLLRYLFLGYLWSLTQSLASTIDIAMSIVEPDYGKIRSGANPLVALAFVVRFENVTVSILYLSMVAVLFASYFLIVVALLRSSLSARLEGRSFAGWSSVAIMQAIFILAGAVIGDAVRPYGQAVQATLSSYVMLGSKLSGLMFHPVGIAQVLQEAAPCVAFLATAFVFWIASGFILNGRRERPVRTVEWAVLAALSFLFAYQTYAVIWLGWTVPDAGNLSFYASGFGMSGFLMLMTAIVVVRIRGGLARRQELEFRPPWLFVPSVAA